MARESARRSVILDESQLKQFDQVFPPRLIGARWTLKYSTESHGYSLKTLYRNFVRASDSPCLLVIKDANKNIFGAFISCGLRMSEHFYGTGESFLFTFSPRFTVFPWTGANDFFVKGEVDSLTIGAGDGNNAIWLDDNLYHGHTHASETFGNGPLTNASEDFVVSVLETWSFII